MKEIFDGLRKYTEKEKQEMIKNSIIVLDTNVLLDFYRLSTKASGELFNALDNYKKNIWLPYYAGVEFYKNKDSICEKASNNLTKIIEDNKGAFNKIIEKISIACKEYKGIKEYDEAFKELNDSKKIFAKIEKFAKETDKKYVESIENIDNQIESLIDSKITRRLSEEEFQNVLKEGQRRIEQKTPPGFEDKDKSEFIYGYQVNGDYIIFNSIINLSQEQNKDIVFITRDNKKDWYDNNSKRINYQLQKEFFLNTNKRIILINCEEFIELHNKITKDKEEKVSISSKKEIKNLTENNNVLGNISLGISEFIKPLKTNYSMDIIKSLAQIEPYFRFNEIIDKEKLIQTIEPLKNLQSNIEVISKIELLNEELQGFNKIISKYANKENLLTESIKIEEDDVEETKDC